MNIDKGTWFNLAWKVVPKLPIPLVEAIGGATGSIVAALRPRSVKQLHRNLEALLGRPVTQKEVREATASYFRSMAEQFSLPGWSQRRVAISATYERLPETLALLEEGPVVLALTHSGNWDLAGAWFAQKKPPIVTVAEKLEPAELFEEFVRFRESLGMEIIGVGPHDSVFQELVRKVEGRQVLVPLLADRDISGSGVRVMLGSEEALVAAGPAALALRLGRPLIAGQVYYERAGRRWKIVLDFTGPIEVPTPAIGETEVEALTRAWVGSLVPRMKRRAVDWHMMQKLYVRDLDPERLARAEEKHGQSERKAETP